MKWIKISECPRLDPISSLMALTVLGVCCWILAMPLSRAVQDASLDRFHLRTKGFGWWAIQQPIPAMYSFENRYWVVIPLESESGRQSDWASHSQRGRLPVVEGGQLAENVQKRSKLLNHFPMRLLTFGDTRPRLLRRGNTLALVVRSRYRDHQRMTYCEAVPQQDGSFVVYRWEVHDRQDALTQASQRFENQPENTDR